MKYITTSSDAETQNIAASLAKEALGKSLGTTGRVFALQGELGAGKTTFAQGFAKGLGIKERVLSPTFLIIKEFHIPESKQGYTTFYHLDCYRVETSKEVQDLNWKEIVSNPHHIVVVEWAERIQDILPLDAVRVSFSLSSKENERDIHIDKEYMQ
ncbi:MAG: tRNA (adenosine(37)-N6)-threonylcarbamoyltransferase complex ATPase subunit type 1 TsaE [archaeon]|nr:tRNA (adenosine(37)-N6)-threonylcarbamoyltransferase complex ATPase subunit type 1 TsaE [archaeon]